MRPGRERSGSFERGSSVFAPCQATTPETPPFITHVNPPIDVSRLRLMSALGRKQTIAGHRAKKFSRDSRELKAIHPQPGRITGPCLPERRFCRRSLSVVAERPLRGGQAIEYPAVIWRLQERGLKGFTRLAIPPRPTGRWRSPSAPERRFQQGAGDPWRERLDRSSA